MERRDVMSAISGLNSNITAPVVVTQSKPVATAAPAPTKSETPPNPPYVVDLTGTALAKSLQLQGQTPTQISVSMGLDIKTVDSYLSVQPSEPTLIPAPAQTPATPANLTPSTSASSTTSPTTPAPTKSSSPTPDLTPNLSPDLTPGSSATQGASGIPAVPAILAPPASFSSQSNNVNFAPSAVKALGI